MFATKKFKTCAFFFMWKTSASGGNAKKPFFTSQKWKSKQKKLMFGKQRFFNMIKYKLLWNLMIFRPIKQKLEPAECFLPPDFLFWDIRVLKNNT